MPLPLIAGAIGGSAARAVGSAIAGAATGVAVDAMIDFGISTLNGSGEPAAVAPPAQITNNVVITNNANNNPDVINDMTIQDEVGGTPRARIGIVRRSALTPELEESGAATVNRVAETPEGRSGLRGLAGAVRNSQPTASNTARLRAARPEVQAAARELARQPANMPVDEDLARELRRSARADGSRTSLEYHEWKFNCISTGKNWRILHENQWHGGSGVLEYIGADGISPFDSPPYHIWVKYEEFRKLINLVKRYRRLRSRCGGRALWQEQGFASRDEAIVDDLAGDADAQALGTTLGATSDFNIVV